MKQKSVILCGLLLIIHLSQAQQFKLMRYDEDHSSLKDSSKSLYSNLKYISLSQHGNTWLSFGGEIRGEVDYVHNEDWGDANLGADFFSLQRYHFHVDLHLTNRIRLFGQLRSGLENGRKTGPRPIDEDQLNVQNLFLDIVPYKTADNSLTLRVGRQEIAYGSGRTIDVREGPNLRLYFDGVKAAYSSANLKVDAFVMAHANVRPGVFDNSSAGKANLWGVYTTYTTSRRRNFDFYYLGINRSNAKFDEGIANELRHSVGARFWKTGTGFVYNFETAYQFGRFGAGNISAAGLSSEIGYVFENIYGQPLIRLRSDYISGDKNKGDGKLGTLNPFYPNGGYFGMNPQVGPSNLLSFHPNFIWHPGKRITLTTDVVFNWRNSLEDGIYNAAGIFRRSSSDSRERYIGTAFISSFSWRINKFLNYNIGVQYFKTGSFIQDVIAQPKDGFFVGSVVSLKF